MKKQFNLLMIAGVALGLAACSSDEPTPSESWKWTNRHLEPISRIELTAEEANANEHLNEFSFKFMQTISQNYNDVYTGINAADGNMTISPLSAAMCLSMVANTCDDATNAKISEALGYSDVETLNSVCNKLLRYLPAKENKVQLHLANSVWYENGYSIKDSYEKQMNRIFGAEVRDFDYDNQEKSLREINGWCSDNTNGMIPQIMNSISPELSLILINAIYFNGEWARKFDKTLTKDEIFHGTLRESNVKMMQTADSKARYAEDESYRAINIDFKDNKYCLTLVLPQDGKDIAEAQNELSYERWRELDFKTVDAKIRFPRFNIDQSLGLKKVLSLFGVPMSGISLSQAGIPGAHNLQIFQKTSTIVNEDGAKFAAVTGSMSVTAPMPQETEKIEITFDRPFIFLFRNQTTGSILMAGRISNI